MTLYTTFKVRDQLFGIEVLLVREINQQMDITYVQKAPDYIRGLINLRGQIVTIFDLSYRLGLGSCKITENAHNIILKSEEELAPIRARENRDDLYCGWETVGLLVDSIGDVIEVDSSRIQPPPANINDIDGRYLSGVVMLDHQLLLAINVKELLKTEH